MERLINNGRGWWLVGALALLVSVSFQGTRGLYETTEGRYAECAREMLVSGDYIQPTLDNEPHWTKPPLTYWGIAAGIRLLGHNAWGVRFYNIIAFCLTALAVAQLGKSLWDEKTGIAAGLIYASSPFPALGAYAVSTDTLLTLWETLAVLSYVKAWRSDEARVKRRWMLSMWALFGLGFLTKGPPALLPLLPILLWRRMHGRQTPLSALPGLLLFGVVGLSWYFVVIVRTPGLLGYFLGREVLGRVASSGVHNPRLIDVFTVYGPPLMVGLGVWLGFVVRVAWKEGLWRPAALRARLRGSPALLFLTLWLAVPLAVFMVSRSKLPLYVLPLYAPIALAAAGAVSRGAYRVRSARAIVVTALAAGVFLACAKGVAANLRPKNDMHELHVRCKPLAQGNTEWVLLSEMKLYGLEFYIQKPLIRLPSPVGDETLEEWQSDMREVLGIRDADSFVFIEDKQHPVGFSAWLTTQGVPCRVAEGHPRWRIYGVPARTAP